ncbi:MAG: class I SAM-dependent RNA methyltransferase [Thermomicrobiales bacterium]
MAGQQSRPEQLTGTARSRVVTIERIVPGGLGLAHDGGKVVLTPLTAPGDRVRIRTVRDQERVAFGAVEEIIEPGPNRIAPPCPYFGRCGGCDFQHLDYEAQLEAKVAIVRDSFRRIAGVELGEIPITPSPDQWNYRTIAEWRHDVAGGAFGYFAAGTRDVVDVTECPIASPALESTLTALRAEMTLGRLPAETTSYEVAEADERVSLLPPAAGLRTCELVRTLGDITYRYDAACFFQANAGIVPALVDEAMRFAEPRPQLEAIVEGEMPHRSTAIDLYCGVGLFTLPLATRFERVVGVEVHAHAAGFARQNAKAAQMENVRIAAMPVDRWLATRGQSQREADLIVLDPPRSGVDPVALAGLIRLYPWRITYVSCDPATLARDLKRVLGSGYELNHVAALDLFPQNHHVEIVAHLARPG